MTQEEMVKEAVEEAKKAAEEQDAAQEAAGEDTEAVAEETVEEEADSEASEEEALEETAEEGSEKGAKGLFKRKPKKDKKDEQIEELKDKLTRQMAEFDNFRKRTEKEKSAMYEIGAKDIIEKILPVVDNFERGLGAVTEEQKEDSFVAGMEMIYKQIMTTLDSVGVKAIEAVGNEFDPDFHNAVMHVEDQEVGENIVVEEFQKGYTYRDTVVRHSMVKVAN
ncbi:MAG: nucleotide exchange factor GrpE [Faecalimonas umbilicata]|uniref:nucleotide exchange factor GrpE n=1 Tax=Faecalimonas umbilicata TaxID=1912855 RepID=UPI001D3658E7|nr:nucleotide exchange factor GrpE [Faecalimonas umbilicata]MBS5763400.1 nucleotide exchange factor GrpE [Lachnospiraceae bacterium]MCI5986256.1 nucleotide exchange factor GrpE [Faecalimonas umbilicata]MDY5094099.1 nucleotide exchange factor GrpE [Faecalimonas umbilicata]